MDSICVIVPERINEANRGSIVSINPFLYTGTAKYLFLENALKKLLNISSNFFLYLKIQSFRLIMENNFIQMAASAGHAVAHTIGPI